MNATTHTIDEADDDIRLDRWFKRHRPGLPHAMLEKHLRKGDIRVDGKKAKASDRIRAGQVIEVRVQGSEFEAQKKKERPVADGDARDLKRRVLHEDANLIVIDKPAGLAVQGGSKIAKSVDGMLGALAPEGGERPKLTHRLDRDTSGVLVLAKSAKAAAAMMKLFSGRRVEKTYLALVHGQPELMRGTIDLPLAKKANPRRDSDGQSRDYEIVTVDEEEGQKAVSHYRVLDTLGRKFSLVEMQPETGRLHQLRAHMKAIGCPIVGDHKYGGGLGDAQAVGVEDRLHLHAWKISLPPVLGGKPVRISAPLPAHMKHSFKALGIDVPK